MRVLFEAADYAVDGRMEVVEAHAVAVIAGGDEGGFVADVGDVGTGESGGLACELVDVEVGFALHIAQVHFEDGHTVGNFGQVHVDLAVETAGTQQCFVENFGTVSGGEDDDAGVGGEAVHFGKQLIESAFAFVVGSERVAFARTANGIDFVDEYDAGGFLLGLAEEVAHARCAHAHKHFHEVAAGEREEGHVGFAGYSLGQQGFTGAGRANEQCTLGDFTAQIGVAVGVLEEVDDFLDLGFGFGEAGHVVEGDLGGIIAVEEHSFGLAHGENAGATAAHSAQQQHPQRNQKHNRAKHPEDVGPCAGLLILDVAGEQAALAPSVDAVGELIVGGNVSHDLALGCRFNIP